MMDFLSGEIHYLWESYLYYLDRADTRVEKWFLMSNYWPSIALTMLYLLTIYFGIKFMENRKAYSCYWGMLVYNVSLVILNIHIWSELVIATTRRGYSYSCQTVDYSDNPDEVRIARALWWFYISKLFEFLDTVFFVLRKKNSQITFLHVYHHATMFPVWWIGIKWVAGGQSFFGALINSFVHILMYTYYCLSALGPKVQPYLWWKKYLTRFQLLQFILGMSHSAQSIYFQCPFPLWMQWTLIIYGTSILLLFINFYVRAYVKPQKRVKTSSSSPPPPQLSAASLPSSASSTTTTTDAITVTAKAVTTTAAAATTTKATTTITTTNGVDQSDGRSKVTSKSDWLEEGEHHYHHHHQNGGVAMMGGDCLDGSHLKKD